ncbi:cytochrome P450 [Kineobactrum sediminis]|uniref:Cytochrome P450 n=1 Tax=Kineobactrum sediminis TaxID=1905677 RepID=A0A2N5Y1L2_9GAMM|nr:cytochrome P450 [Kineobactrum sediminis]PLW82277.1 cytochrome P450 [Kineobactrum sediminis]
MLTVSPLMPGIDFAYDELPDLHERLDELRAIGPVVPVTYHGETVWLITRYRELKQAFSDEEHFASKAAYTVHSEPSMGKTLQTMSGQQHRINRMLVSKPFFPKQVRHAVESLIAPIADELLNRLSDREEVDLVEAFTRPYPFTVITRMLGIPVNDEDKLLEWALKLIDYPWDPQGALRARSEFADYMQPIVEERRVRPGDDVISLLATAEFEGQRLGDEEIYSFLRLLFPAGSDTTYKVAGSLFYAILSDPTVRAQATESDSAREAIVQEALRWQPPTALLPRCCSKDTELAGIPIKQGDWILFGISAAHRDPEVFEDPHHFNPSRTEKNLAFGHGEHFCLGSHLARCELETAIERLFARFPKLRLCPDRPVRFSGGVLRGTPELWVHPYG